jgi:hypothetical protein
MFGASPDDLEVCPLLVPLILGVSWPLPAVAMAMQAKQTDPVIALMILMFVTLAN